MGIRTMHASLPLTLATTLGVLGSGCPGLAQVAGPAARIAVGRETQVSKACEKRPHAEVILAADRDNPGRLLAGSMVMDPGMGASVVAYSSGDAGRTWELTLEKKAEPGGRWYGDPSVAFGPDGVAYFAAMFSAGLGREITSSRDGGRTWAAPARAGHLVDRPFLLVDNTVGGFRGRVYCVESADAELVVHRSRDGARSFDRPVRLVCEGSAQGRTFGEGVVLSDGSLVVPYSVLIRATDEVRSLRVQRSETGGESFLGEQILRDYTAPVDAFPIMAVDPGSGAFKDRLYLVWSERTEAGRRVMLTFSRDKGANWPEPVAISEERGVDGEDQAAGHHAYLPTVAVNREGVVAVSWYDATRRGGALRSHVRLRASLDGGSTWLPSVQVTGYVGRSESEAGENWVGHTAGLAADASGTFHPLWVDDRTGVRQIFTAAVVVR